MEALEGNKSLKRARGCGRNTRHELVGEGVEGTKTGIEPR